ncbi:hypothetical protein [Methylomonas rivi]|uniref:GAF domain-containing protein n=1 Tax=Methylomonas rivi TaxID=2952226 RepID=A0ABT1U3Q0_9GAMM|nr:hypothetical protein [Methylomonas sp. WSC-6]MCQ8128475.1 hypothetical protein [Methylomonas sp. WSC-6]
MLNKYDIGVIHWINGAHTWRLGVPGFFLRPRGFIVVSSSSILTVAGVFSKSLFLSSYIPEKVEVAGKNLFLLSVSTFLGIFTLAFFYVRSRSQRSLNIKAELHNLLHESRDEICNLQSRISQYPDNLDPIHISSEKNSLVQFSNKICEIIAKYFAELVRDKTVGAAIRMSAFNPNNQNNAVSYVTIGRANLSPGRKDTSEPIPKSEGIVKFFMEKNIEGALYYHDLEKAAVKGLYKRTKNDDDYPEDIKTLIVAPISAWNGEKKDLVGLLFITSKTSKIMHPRHVDLINFTADCLSVIYTCIFFKLGKLGFTTDKLVK